MFADIDTNIVIEGDIFNMVQILDNLIKNAIQSYDGKESQNAKLSSISKNENKVMIIVKDYGCGIPEEISLVYLNIC